MVAIGLFIKAVFWIVVVGFNRSWLRLFLAVLIVTPFQALVFYPQAVAMADQLDKAPPSIAAFLGFRFAGNFLWAAAAKGVLWLIDRNESSPPTA